MTRAWRTLAVVHTPMIGWAAVARQLIGISMASVVMFLPERSPMSWGRAALRPRPAGVSDVPRFCVMAVKKPADGVWRRSKMTPMLAAKLSARWPTKTRGLVPVGTTQPAGGSKVEMWLFA